MKPKAGTSCPGVEFGLAATSAELHRITWMLLFVPLSFFLAHSAFPPEFMVKTEYLEREPPKVYPGCSGVYPYHPFPMGFAISESSCRGASSPPGIQLQRGFRHIPNNYRPGNAASVSVSSSLSITSGNTAVYFQLPSCC